MGEELQQVGPVVRSNLFAQRQKAQQDLINAAKASPVANNVQEVVDAANIAPKGAVGQDSPMIQQINKATQKYAPMLMGEKVKTGQEQMLDRNAQFLRQQAQKPINPNSSTDGIDSVLGHWTSPEEEEKLRKASAARQRIFAIGDAIRHLGNIWNTSRYAPSQQFNSPVENERNRYLQDKSLRDQANQRIMSYQMAKAAQDTKNKQWEADFSLKVADAARKAGATEAQIQNMKDRLAEQHRVNDLNYGLSKDKFSWQKERGERQDKETARHHKVAEGNQAKSINLRKQIFEWKKVNGGNGSNVPPLDTPNGKIQPNGSNYANQLLQMWDYAKANNLVSESDVQKALANAGMGNETPDNVKRQQVLTLLRTNKLIGDYAQSRLGWSYGGGTNLDLGLEDDDDSMNLGLE